MALRASSATASLGGLPVSIANGGTGASTAATAFAALKQAATTTATGVVELATTAETIAGTSAAVVPTAQSLGQSGSLRQGLIASAAALDFAIDTDQALTFIGTPTLWIPTHVIARRVSGSFGVACVGGIYTAASKSGTSIINVAQSWAALSGASKYASATISATALTDVMTATTLFLSLTTANTGALTADVFVFGLTLG